MTGDSIKIRTKIMNDNMIICRREEDQDGERRTDEPGMEFLERFAISRKPCGRGGAATSSTREGPAPQSAAHNWSGCVDRFDEDRGGRSKLVSSITA
jgi:hypothetical protein